MFPGCLCGRSGTHTLTAGPHEATGNQLAMTATKAASRLMCIALRITSKGWRPPEWRSSRLAWLLACGFRVLNELILASIVLCLMRASCCPTLEATRHCKALRAGAPMQYMPEQPGSLPTLPGATAAPLPPRARSVLRASCTHTQCQSIHRGGYPCLFAAALSSPRPANQPLPDHQPQGCPAESLMAVHPPRHQRSPGLAYVCCYCVLTSTPLTLQCDALQLSWIVEGRHWWSQTKVDVLLHDLASARALRGSCRARTWPGVPEALPCGCKCSAAHTAHWPDKHIACAMALLLGLTQGTLPDHQRAAPGVTVISTSQAQHCSRRVRQAKCRESALSAVQVSSVQAAAASS